MSRDRLSNDTMPTSEMQTTSAIFDQESAEQSAIDDWLSKDEESSRWHRYSLISSSLKGELGGTSVVDISEQVSAAIAAQIDKPEVIKTSMHSRSAAVRKAAARWLQPTAKVAVAAGVAVVAVLTVQTYQQPNLVPGNPASEQPSIMTAPIGGSSQPVSYSPAGQTQAASQETPQQSEQLRRQAQSYLIDHQQQLMILQTPAAEQPAQKAEENSADSPN
ncbi:negative regulator of sigma E activity [Idiomarina seosinensis]|uniref:sigma-E factor negative regulatory protein n=1 Tax=Idiomarina seosinensis TaxID=281739 RepID=UPI003850CEAD